MEAKESNKRASMGKREDAHSEEVGGYDAYDLEVWLRLDGRPRWPLAGRLRLPLSGRPRRPLAGRPCRHYSTGSQSNGSDMATQKLSNYPLKNKNLITV